MRLVIQFCWVGDQTKKWLEVYFREQRIQERNIVRDVFEALTIPWHGLFLCWTLLPTEVLCYSDFKTENQDKLLIQSNPSTFLNARFSKVHPDSLAFSAFSFFLPIFRRWGALMGAAPDPVAKNGASAASEAASNTTGAAAAQAERQEEKAWQPEKCHYEALGVQAGHFFWLNLWKYRYRSIFLDGFSSVFFLWVELCWTVQSLQPSKVTATLEEIKKAGSFRRERQKNPFGASLLLNN